MGKPEDAIEVTQTINSILYHVIKNYHYVIKKVVKNGAIHNLYINCDLSKCAIYSNHTAVSEHEKISDTLWVSSHRLKIETGQWAVNDGKLTVTK